MCIASLLRQALLGAHSSSTAVMSLHSPQPCAIEGMDGYLVLISTSYSPKGVIAQPWIPRKKKKTSLIADFKPDCDLKCETST